MFSLISTLVRKGLKDGVLVQWMNCSRYLVLDAAAKRVSTHSATLRFENRSMRAEPTQRIPESSVSNFETFSESRRTRACPEP